MLFLLCPLEWFGMEVVVFSHYGFRLLFSNSPPPGAPSSEVVLNGRGVDRTALNPILSRKGTSLFSLSFLPPLYVSSSPSLILPSWLLLLCSLRGTTSLFLLIFSNWCFERIRSGLYFSFMSSKESLFLSWSGCLLAL